MYVGFLDMYLSSIGISSSRPVLLMGCSGSGIGLGEIPKSSCPQGESKENSLERK